MHLCFGNYPMVQRGNFLSINKSLLIPVRERDGSYPGYEVDLKFFHYPLEVLINERFCWEIFKRWGYKLISILSNEVRNYKFGGFTIY